MTRKKAKHTPPWFKVFSHKIIAGSVRFDLESDERGVWFDLLSLANESPVRGVICYSKGRPYPHDWIANTLRIPLELLERTLEKCKAEGRISEDGAGIHITNWAVYQVKVEARKEGSNDKDGVATREKHFKECPDCHYLVEISKLTERMEICPQCKKKGKEVLLVRKGEQ
ncbi:hypothetical protein ES703_65742 [subsurface metagenome]|jgi:hypothetical protein